MNYTKVISALWEDVKALTSIFFTLSEINISFIFLHSAKIVFSIFLSDNHSIFSRSLQQAKQLCSTAVFLLNLTEVRPLPIKARASIFLTPEKSNCIKSEHPKKQSAEITSHWQCHVTDCSLLHPLNVPLSRISIFSVK